MSLSRRSFLVASAGALAGSSLAASPASASAPLPVPVPGTANGPGRPWAPKKAVKYGMVDVKGSLLDHFAVLRDCGFDGVELDSPGDWKLDEVLAAKEKTGLQVPGVVDSVHWGKPLSDPDEAVRAQGRAGLERAIRDAKAVGASSVLLVPAVVQKKVPYLDAWTRSQDEVKKLLPLAAELQIHVLIENVWNHFLLGPTELARYVDELQSPWAGVHFDAGNLVQFGWPEHWVPVLGKRIKKVDVKDYKRGKANYDGFQVKLNDGDADWPSIVAALKQVGYDGWFAAEVAGGDATWLKELAGRMDAFLRG